MSSPYAARPWLQHYDYWVRPHMTYPTRPLYEILSTTAAEMPDGHATQFLGAALTYRDIKQRTDRLARALRRLGIAKGDRVGIMLPNCPQYIVSAFAVLRLGGVVVNINPTYTARELQNVATDSGARVLITLDRLAPLALEIRATSDIEQIIVTSMAEYSAEAAAPPRVADTLSFADLTEVEDGSDLPLVAIAPGGPGRPAIHRRDHGDAQGRDAHARQHLRQRRADRDLALPPVPSRRGTLSAGHPVFPHLRVHRRHDVRRVGRGPPDPHPEVRRRAGAGGHPRLQADLFSCGSYGVRVAAGAPEDQRVRARFGALVQQRRRALPRRGDGGVRNPHRPATQPGVRAVRDVAGDAFHAAAGAAQVRVDRLADARHRHEDRGRRDRHARDAAGRGRRAVHLRAAGDEGLLEPAGRVRQRPAAARRRAHLVSHG